MKGDDRMSPSGSRRVEDCEGWLVWQGAAPAPALAMSPVERGPGASFRWCVASPACPLRLVYRVRDGHRGLGGAADGEAVRLHDPTSGSSSDGCGVGCELPVFGCSDTQRVGPAASGGPGPQQRTPEPSRPVGGQLGGCVRTCHLGGVRPDLLAGVAVVGRRRVPDHCRPARRLPQRSGSVYVAGRGRVRKAGSSLSTLVGGNLSGGGRSGGRCFPSSRARPA